MFTNQMQCSVLQIIALVPDEPADSINEVQTQFGKNKALPLNDDCDISKNMPERMHDMTLREISFCMFDSPIKQEDRLHYSLINDGIQIVEEKRMQQRTRLQRQYETLSQLQQVYAQKKRYLLNTEQKMRANRNKKLQLGPIKITKRKNQTCQKGNITLKKQEQDISKDPAAFLTPIKIEQATVKSQQSHLNQTIPLINQQITLTDDQQLILKLIYQLKIMNNAFLTNILNITKEQAEKYLKDNYYRLNLLIKYKSQCYQDNMSNLYLEPNKIIQSLFLLWLKKINKMPEIQDLASNHYPQFQNTSEKNPNQAFFCRYKWKQLK